VARVTAVEVDPGLAEALAVRLRGTNVDVVQADAADTGLPSASFSSAACFTMLHHVPTAEQQDRLFAEVCRLLDETGVFVGVDSLDTERIRRGHVDDVFNPVDPDTLGERLRTAGFAAVDLEHRDDRIRFRAANAQAGLGRT
jgi:SAM-dependent methyltransferase